jgi:hypothetical protein
MLKFIFYSMRKNLLKAYSFLLILTLISCIGNKEYIPPNMPEKLSVIGIFDADDTAQTITFEKSYQNDYPAEYNDSLKKLSFIISSDNEVFFNYSNDKLLNRRSSFAFHGNRSFTTGGIYTLNANEETVDKISARAVVPTAPEQFSVTFLEYKTEVTETFCNPKKVYAILNLSFTGNKESYYCILIRGTGSTVHIAGRDTILRPNCKIGYSVTENSSPGFSAVIPGMIRNDYFCGDWVINYPQVPYSAYFLEGKTLPVGQYNIKLKIGIHYDLFDYKKPIKIELCSVPKELYLFEKSLYLQLRDSRDPFSEPVYLNGNIIGGNGIFAIYRGTEQTLTLPF